MIAYSIPMSVLQAAAVGSGSRFEMQDVLAVADGHAGGWAIATDGRMVAARAISTEGGAATRHLVERRLLEFGHHYPSGHDYPSISIPNIRIVCEFEGQHREIDGGDVTLRVMVLDEPKTFPPIDEVLTGLTREAPDYHWIALDAELLLRLARAMGPLHDDRCAVWLGVPPKPSQPFVVLPVSRDDDALGVLMPCNADAPRDWRELAERIADALADAGGVPKPKIPEIPS